ncbi:uncharacterized protein TNCV_2013261 [Trichonephila clavipes]|nr:uncharacterized protein TNCV_2013261 [Trichonephila clavipes]
MGMTNNPRIWGHKPSLVGEKANNSTRREDDERDDELLWDILATAHQNVWFMHDSAPEYFSISELYQLDATYPGRWNGRGGTIAWPSCSPGLNPLNFFFWSHLKSLVHETLVATLEDLITWIVIASNDITSTPDLLDRI